MQPILGKIIDPIQCAFILNLSIHDSILLLHEIMNKFKTMKGKKAWVALKLDMKKAYDRAEWIKKMHVHIFSFTNHERK